MSKHLQEKNKANSKLSHVSNEVEFTDSGARVIQPLCELSEIRLLLKLHEKGREWHPPRPAHQDCFEVPLQKVPERGQEIDGRTLN